jgi:cytoskeletal protein RodZ
MNSSSMTEERVQFGAKLKQQREARALSVPDVVKLTKIPERSLNLLEGGVFEELPAEVFVRGFLKSYCRAVGLDADETIHAYDGLVKADRPRTVPSLARVGQSRERDRDRDRDRTPEPEKEPEKDDNTIFTALSEAGKGTGRMGLTLAVIILVIVATLTLSLLLRRPSHVGDGVSQAALIGGKVG